MNLESHKINVVGEIEVSIYDKSNKLVNKINKKNTITESGLSCLRKMLTQGLDSGSPSFVASDEEETSMLSNENMFSGISGEIPFYTPVIINGKKYSEISLDGKYNTQVKNSKNMFLNNEYLSTNFNSYSLNIYDGDLFVPNSDYFEEYNDRKNNCGYIFDISIKKIDEEIILISSTINLSNNNLKYNTFKVIQKDNSGDVTELFDFDCGSRTENGSITFKTGTSANIADYLNKVFVVTYYKYDFQDEYISGIRLDIRSDNQTIVDNEYLNVSLSFNQGKTRTNAIFPMVSGNPNQCLYAKNSGLKLDNKMTSYFFSISPWYTKIPNQVCVLLSNKSNGLGNIYVEKIQFFKLRTPTVSPLGIYLKENTFYQKVKIYKKSIDVENNSVLFFGKLGYGDGNGHTFTNFGLCNLTDNVLYYEDDAISSKFSEDLTQETKFYKINIDNKELYDNILTEAIIENGFTKTADNRIDFAYKININWGT